MLYAWGGWKPERLPPARRGDPPEGGPRRPCHADPQKGPEPRRSPEGSGRGGEADVRLNFSRSLPAAPGASCENPENFSAGPPHQDLPWKALRCRRSGTPPRCTAPQPALKRAWHPPCMKRMMTTCSRKKMKKMTSMKLSKPSGLDDHHLFRRTAELDRFLHASFGRPHGCSLGAVMPSLLTGSILGERRETVPTIPQVIVLLPVGPTVHGGSSFESEDKACAPLLLSTAMYSWTWGLTV